MSLKSKPLLIALALVATPLLIRFLRPVGTPHIRNKGKGKSVALLHKVPISGTDQWVLERSEDINNPVVLFLHGGPGTSQLGLNRRNTKEMEKHAIVVNWDQRGAGKSYKALKDIEGVNIDLFVQDTRELTIYLLKKYRKEKIVLVGHSWGSVIGIMAAAKYPELYHCYVGIGQIANMKKGEAESYLWTLEQAKKRKYKKAMQALEKMGPPPYSGDWQAKTIRQRSYLARFGGEVYGSRFGAMPKVLASLLFSREYNGRDCVNFFKGIFRSIKLLWPELMTVDLFKTVTELKVPVFFFEGRFDQEVPATVAAHYFEQLTAHFKKLFWFEHSAHLLNTEERQLFNRIMVERVLPLATQGATERHEANLT